MTTPADLLRNAKRVGFLFSGGSTRCAFQIGVVETLLELGIRPSACLGVSGGAWNAAAVGAGAAARLRPYWRCFARMPHLDLRNLAREYSPFIWSRMHERTFNRYVGNDAIRTSEVDILIAVTRLRDQAPVVFDLRRAADPFRVLLASNYLPPFYTRRVVIDGEAYGDGGATNNLPYEVLFDRGCDAVVLMASKGESEGGLFRNMNDFEHAIPAQYVDRTVVIRPRHRMALDFTERRWDRLNAAADLGRLRAREVLLGEMHPETDVGRPGSSLSLRLARTRQWLRRHRREAAPPMKPIEL
jgi:predicted acylesterase/phospholipase RssA